MSPNERLLWHNEHDLHAVAISPLIPRRGKKRARSSSPTSSPGYSKPTTPAVNVKKLTQALKSPDADPALDLWDRFASGATASKNPLGATNPALAYLMESSSPRPQKVAPAAPGERDLRRAISCGTTWPKRRRVDDKSPSGRPRPEVSTSKSSMVNALLQTVSGEINKTEEAEAQDVEMQSPSPKKRRSPRKATPLLEPTELPELPQVEREESPATVRADSPGLPDAKAPTSDYGDDEFEFDEDTLLVLDASMSGGRAEEGSVTKAPEVPVVTMAGATSQAMGFDDEFDDLDDDLFAAADDLIADAAVETISQAPQAPPVQVLHQNGGTEEAEDEYGDDFGGDFDFDAVELAATQSVAQSNPSLSHVCTS